MSSESTPRPQTPEGSGDSPSESSNDRPAASSRDGTTDPSEIDPSEALKKCIVVLKSPRHRECASDPVNDHEDYEPVVQHIEYAEQDAAVGSDDAADMKLESEDQGVTSPTQITTETASMPGRDDTTTYHIDSDTVIALQDHSTRCHVSSCCLAAASPVWRTMLYGQNAAGRPEHGEWVINLKGDPKAVDTLLRIVHYEFDKVPETLDMKELYEIGLVIERYKCAHLVHPYAKGWVQPFLGFAQDPRGFTDAHLVASLAWTLGAHGLYRDMADNLALSVSIDKEGDVVNIKGEKLKELDLPEGLLEIITKVRSDTIQSILKGIEHPVRMLSEPGKSTLNFCKVNQDTEFCSTMIAGSTLPPLLRMGLFPVPDVSKFTGSVLSIKMDIEKISTTPYVGPNFKPHLSHEECNLGLNEMITACLINMADTVSKDHITHLDSRARLTGLNNLAETTGLSNVARDTGATSVELENSTPSKEQMSIHTLLSN